MTPAVQLEGGAPTTGTDRGPGVSAAMTQPAAGRPGSSRLAGIDGLRAFAALWVVFFHIYAVSNVRLAAIPGLDLFLRSGSTGVSLFLVLSGFCLYLPFAGGRTGRFKSGAFFRRRWRRLMPAYYASLPVSLALTLVGGARLGFPHLTWSQAAFHILTHVTMTYTLFPSTFYSLNGVYWSLALEWQLYLALPLLVWGVKRYGLRKTAATAILCNVVYRLLLSLAIDHGVVARDSLLATAVLPNQLPGRWAEFVLGMIAADLYVTGRINAWARRVPYIVPVLVPIGFLTHDWPLGHIVFGCVFFGLVSMVLASNNVVGKVFSWTPLVAIGTMSYSVYLVHQLVIRGLVFLIRVHGHASPTETFVLLVLLLPLILLPAWVLFITVERYTLGARPALGSGTATAILFPSFTLLPWRGWPHPTVRAMVRSCPWIGRPFR